MTDALRLLAGIALPWMAGFALLRAMLTRCGARNALVEVGYGHFVGILLVTLLLRAFDGVGLGLSAVPTSVALTVIFASALWYSGRWNASPGDVRSTPAPEPRWLRWLAIAALALIVLKAATLAIDVLLRPLFPWDAWSQWGTKAKAWSGLREMVPFVDHDTWLAGDGTAYTDTAPNYPAMVPLLQTWMTLVLGRWDDALMNLPWLAAFVAFAIGMYGQLRRLGTSRAIAAIATYMATSLPMLNVHVALAGYADLHTGAAYALAVLALAEWERYRTRSALVLIAFPAAMLPLLKVSGIAWLGTIVAGLVIATWGRTRIRIIAGLVVVLALTAAIALTFGRGRVIVPPAAEQQTIVESLVQQLFAFGSWNLAWYLVPLVALVCWREVLASRAVTITLGCGFGFLAWTFFFTRLGDWVIDYTTVNRALLHIMPAAIAFGALLLARTAQHPVASTTRMPEALPTARPAAHP